MFTPKVNIVSLSCILTSMNDSELPEVFSLVLEKTPLITLWQTYYS